MLSYARFDWLVGNVRVYQENLSQSRSKKTAFFFICRITFEKYFIKATEDFFRVSIASSKHSGEVGEFSTVMQTFDCVSGLQNCLEFSQFSLVFRRGYENTKNILSCLIKVLLEEGNELNRSLMIQGSSTSLFNSFSVVPV